MRHASLFGSRNSTGLREFKVGECRPQNSRVAKNQREILQAGKSQDFPGKKLLPGTRVEIPRNSYPGRNSEFLPGSPGRFLPREATTPVCFFEKFEMKPPPTCPRLGIPTRVPGG
eukprot:1398548-Rhodomonas_salina.2